MPDLRFLVVGDVHLSDQSPGRRTETYTEDILRKCEELVEIAKGESCTHVLFLGDIFDNKNPYKVSHRLVQRISNILVSFGLPVYILVGNHDISSDTLSSIPKQPIGILDRLPGVTLLEWDPVEIEDVRICPIPGVSIRGEEDWKERYNVDCSGASRTIIVAHQDIVPDITKENPQIHHVLQDSYEIAANTGADMVLYGHIHTNHGTYTRENMQGGKTVFSNRGAVCRLSAHATDVNAKPEVLILDLVDDGRRSVKARPVVLKSVRPSDEVYALEEYVEEKSHKEDIDQTIKRLKSTKVGKFSIDAVIKEIEQNSSAPNPVRTKALDLLETVR